MITYGLIKRYKEKHTCDMQEMFTSYDGVIVEVTDLREGGDVRGSPLTVAMGTQVLGYWQIPC